METIRGQRMIRSKREFAILELIEREGVVSVRALAERWPAIADVTFRRDLARLEVAGRLRRTHGGAVRLGAQPARGSAAEPGGSAAEQADALILPPIGGRWAHTLREHARRRGIPLIAESSPQEGGTYVGPDNRRAGRELGRLAARAVARRGEDSAEILLLSLEELPNTRDRTRGFAEGFREAFAGTVRTHLIDGRGAFGRAYRSALDALQAFPSIDVLFGVNDHSIMAAIEACRRLGRPEGSYAAFSVGGEGGTLLEELARDGPLQACAALFPEVVGRLATDTACRRISDAQCPARVETRFDLLTPRNLGDYYAKVGEQWRLRAEVRERMAGGAAVTLAPERAIAGKRISFVPHYPAHEWYRNLAAAMAERAAELGVVFAARNAADRHALEVTELRRVIAGAAAATVGDGETILLDGGPVSRLVAGRLAGRRGLTVVTNSLEVLDSLGGGGGGPGGGRAGGGGGGGARPAPGPRDRRHPRGSAGRQGLPLRRRAFGRLRGVERRRAGRRRLPALRRGRARDRRARGPQPHRPGGTLSHLRAARRSHRHDRPRHPPGVPPRAGGAGTEGGPGRRGGAAADRGGVGQLEGGLRR